MKKSELKALIREVIEEVTGGHEYKINISFVDIYDRRNNGDIDMNIKAANDHDAQIEAIKEFWKTHDDLKIRITDVIVDDNEMNEIAANEPAINPSYIDVKVGDKYVGKDIHRFGNITWVYVSTVLEMLPIQKRFGKDDRIVTVKVETYDMEQGKMRSVVDHKKQIWVSQLLKGLV
jgi:hypothetical protein